MSRLKALLLLAIAVMLILIPTDRHGAKSAASPARGIAGSWISAPSAPAVGRVPSVPNLLSLSADGTAVGFSPFADEVGRVGVWSAANDGTVTITFQALHKKGGEFVGLWKIRGKMRPDPATGQYVGGGTVDVFDAQQKLVRSFQYKSRWTRINVESP